MSKPDPPRPDTAQVDAATARILHRHRDTDHHLDDGDGPQGILDYLRKCGTAGLRSGPGNTHDVTDMLILNLALHWQQQDNERWAIRASERLGLNRRRTGLVLGLKVGQALVDRLNRLEARLGAGRRDTAVAARADDTGTAFTNLARHLVRTAQTWYDDELDLMVDPDLLAEQRLLGGVSLRDTLAYLLKELDAASPGWFEALDVECADALSTARPHLTRRSLNARTAPTPEGGTVLASGRG